MEYLKKQYADMEYHTTNEGFKCTKVDAAELLRQAVRKMTRPKDKRPKDKKIKKREQPGTLWRKVQALNKLVKAAEKAGEEHLEHGESVLKETQMAVTPKNPFEAWLSTREASSRASY